MRNYIILNNINSSSIPGLLISSLPPITKPLIRTSIEEIDGRDGDIVTTLGYSAYDKEFEIGLYGNYDVNEIISYFNSSGIVVFSNEPDKYYNYQILEHIDYNRLIRFRTATVRMHIQPFKYSLTDNEKCFTINNSLKYPNYTSNSNNLVLTASNGKINITGTANRLTEFYVPITDIDLVEGSYTLSAYTNGTGSTACSIRLINNNATDEDSFGGTSLSLQDNSTVTLNSSIDEPESYNYLYINVPYGVEADFELDVEMKNDNPTDNITIYNSGNIYSKPIITINGTGLIELDLNSISVFTIDMGSYTSITIDINKMEAYNGSILLNRNISGYYENFRVIPGKNIISWTGDISQIIINNYSRWI